MRRRRCWEPQQWRQPRSLRQAPAPSQSSQVLSVQGCVRSSHLRRQLPLEYRSAACSHKQGSPVRLRPDELSKSNTPVLSGKWRTRNTAVVACGELSDATHVSVFTFQTRTCELAREVSPSQVRNSGVARRTVPSLETDASK